MGAVGSGKSSVLAALLQELSGNKFAIQMGGVRSLCLPALLYVNALHCSKDCRFIAHIARTDIKPMLGCVLQHCWMYSWVDANMYDAVFIIAFVHLKL